MKYYGTRELKRLVCVCQRLQRFMDRCSGQHSTPDGEYALSTARFKHEVYAYALYYTNKHKAIYLYQGRTRYAKAWFSTPNNMKIEFSSPEHQELFHKCREDPTGSRSRLEEPFFLRYEYNTDLNMYIRKQ